MQVTVKLATREGAAHISGILAGFILLAKCGELTLQVQDERQGSPIAREALLESPTHALLAAQVQQMFDKAGPMN